MGLAAPLHMHLTFFLAFRVNAVNLTIRLNLFLPQQMLPWFYVFPCFSGLSIYSLGQLVTTALLGMSVNGESSDFPITPLYQPYGGMTVLLLTEKSPCFICLSIQTSLYYLLLQKSYLGVYIKHLKSYIVFLAESFLAVCILAVTSNNTPYHSLNFKSLVHLN